MPDKPTYSKREHPGKRTLETAHTPARQPRRRAYAELQCHTNFSLLLGASHPEELVERAAALGYEAIAITDRHTLAGVVRMHCAAKTHGIKLIVGVELIPADARPVLLYAINRVGYGNLCRIITNGRLRSKKGECRVTFDDIATHHEGLLAAIPIPGGKQDQGNKAKGSRDQGIEGRRDGGSEPRPSGSGTKEERDEAVGGMVHAQRDHDQTHTPGRDTDREGSTAPGIERYRRLFGKRLYLIAGVHAGTDDALTLARAGALSRQTHVPLIATNDVHYHRPERRFLQDVLTCIRLHRTLSDAGKHLFANAERHLKPIDELAALFSDLPDAVTRTTELADRCTFSLDELRYEYPEALCPPDRTPHDFLTELTWHGADKHYPDGIPDKVRDLIKHELNLISELAYEPYFLTVWDIVTYARSRDILCQGRGSAANSVVCYCLGITSVDPDRIDLLFERFVSAERNEPPDIDVDFEHERREEVFQYIYEKYGREHAGIVAEVITYRPRSAIRDVGKALGLSLDRVATLAKKHEWWDQVTLPGDFLREVGFDPNDRTVRMLAKLVRQLVGFPRHLSQHVGGFVITRGPLCEMVPLQNGAMPGRTFIEWDKDDIDALGILKIDCLALGMLTAIHKCFRLLAGHAPTSLASVPPEDPAVYDMICRADTVGVFQIESRAQMGMLPRLKPRRFYDLVIEVAIVRPGPIQGGMVHPYLRRRNGEEPVSYPSEAIKEVLKRTLGVPLFQEQAMRLAVVAAGFTPGEADQLRRAMGAWRKNGDIARFRTKLLDGMRERGLSEEFAERCFKQICGFGEYGFPESHAASFASLVYVSAWLKRYHPAGFCAAILNSLPMGFYQPAQLVRDAREHGVTVRGVDVNMSGYDCRMEEEGAKGARDQGIERRRDRGIKGSRDRGSKGSRDRGIKGSRDQGKGTEDQSRDRQGAVRRDVGSAVRTIGEGSRDQGIKGSRDQGIGGSRKKDAPENWGIDGPTVRLGMRLIRGISPAQVEGIERARMDRPFTSVADLARRSSAARVTLLRLAAADAMQSLGLDRRQAAWEVLALGADPQMFEEYEPIEPTPDLPGMSLEDTVREDYSTIGLSLHAHPMALIRADLARLGAEPTRILKHARQGQWLCVAGMVLVRQRPSTASGVVFCTLEDETGIANLIIRPQFYEKYRRTARGAAVLIAKGRVERQGEVIHLNVTHLADASRQAPIHAKSRDFH